MKLNLSILIGAILLVVVSGSNTIVNNLSINNSAPLNVTNATLSVFPNEV